MDCKSIKNEGAAERYLHNRLNEEDTDSFETHLLECANCRSEVELLQAARTDLAARAHEIRTWTPTKPFFLRWQTMSVAALVVVVVVAGAFFFHPKKTGPVLTAQRAPSDGSPKDWQTEGSPKQATTNAKPNPSGNPQNSDKRIEDTPVNGREYKNFTITNSQVTRDVSPKTGPAPNSGLTVAGSRARSNSVTVDGADAVDNSVNGVRPRPSQEVVQGFSKPKPQEDPNQVPKLTAEQGVELYRLANVVAPPFTFTGFNASGTPTGGQPRSTHSKSAQTVDTGRKVFREAMVAYVEGNYGESAQLLEEAAKKEPEALDVKFYLGVSRILSGHPQEAIDPLRQASSVKGPVFQQQAHYYLAKAYLQGMQFKEAEDELRTAADLTGPLKADSADLLSRLQALRAQIEKED